MGRKQPVCFVVRNQDESETCEAYVCKEDVFDLQGSRGIAHFIKKWPGEQQQSYLKLIDVKNITGERLPCLAKRGTTRSRSTRNGTSRM